MAPGLHGCAPADPLPPWPSPGQGPRELGDPQLKPQATWTVGTATSGAAGCGGRGSLVAQSPSAGKGLGEGCWPQGGPVGAVAWSSALERGQPRSGPSGASLQSRRSGKWAQGGLYEEETAGCCVRAGPGWGVGRGSATSQGPTGARGAAGPWKCNTMSTFRR